MAIKQIKVGFDNFSYIIYCQKTKKSAIVDPGNDIYKLIDFISYRNFHIKYIINTHHHSDHTSGNIQIKNKYPNVELVTSIINEEKLSDKKYLFVEDQDSLQLGYISLKFILTPGHTEEGICIIVDNEAILTGDTLFIGDCGRTDLPGGSLSQMFDTLQKIKALPGHLIVYPGHDYGDKQSDTLANQVKTNKTLIAKNLEEFSKIY